MPPQVKPIIVTYWWGRGVCKNTSRNYFTNNLDATPMTYPDMVERLKQQAHRHGFDFYAEELKGVLAKGGYQKAISYKATFIRKMIDKWKRSVLYLDCDMHIHNPPVMFTTDQYDFMAFNWNADTRVSTHKSVLFDWNVLETSGGIFYFNNTTPARRLLASWKSALLKHPSKADDRLLAMSFKEFDKKTLRYYWIPMEYFYVPQYYRLTIPHNKVVISHPYALTDEDDALALAGTRDRVPKEYERMVARTAKHHTHVVEMNENDVLIKCIRERNRSLIKAGITYNLNNNRTTEPTCGTKVQVIN